ncbi:MAG TPA: hypothetical protein VEB66_16450 [Opitutaceae bacterium]|nr:hypothetical protein [Opitutaceae bacterium]
MNIRAIVAWACLAAAPGRAVEPIAVAAPAGGDAVQVLFMGTDVVILKDRDFHRVIAISEGAYVIEQRGRPVRVPLDSKEIRLKVEPSLKLSGVSVQVDKLKSARGYTPGNDPRRRRLAEAGAAGGALAAVDAATDQLITAASAQQNVFIAGAQPQQALSDLGTQTAQKDSALVAAKSQETSPGDYADRLVGDLVEEAYDAMDVEFELSSATPLADPSVVVVMRYRHRGAPRGTERDMIHAQTLDGLDAAPRRIVVRQGGFPRGFTLDEVQVHVYDGGREVASNVAPKRVALGRDEAFQYILMEHAAAHRGETIPAAPALGTLTEEQRGQIPADQLARTFHVKVGKDGRALAAYTDAACTVRVSDRAVAEALGQILYKPALDKGRPAEGVAAVRLDTLPR